MNKPIPALDERGEFVEAQLRCGETMIITTLDGGERQPIRALTGAGWYADGRWLGLAREDHDYDIINVDELRATVERARKMRSPEQVAEENTSSAEPYYGALAAFASWLEREMPAGAVISNPRWWAPRIIRAVDRARNGAVLRTAPARPTPLEALETAALELRDEFTDNTRLGIGELLHVVQRARRASEG